MKPRKFTGGYTIVEVMIFLTVSMVMFASVVGVVTSQSRRNQFTESVNTFNQRIQDILNDVDTGYFPSNSDFNCSINGSGLPVFGATAVEQGKNQDCVFGGKSIEIFGSEIFKVETLVGRRTLAEGGVTREVNTVTEANLTPLNPAFSPAVTADSGSLSADVRITKVRPVNTSTDVTKFGILTGFGQSSGAGTTSLKTGAIKSQLAVFNSGAWDTNVPNGILLCLAEGGDPTNGRTATITLGGSGSQASSIVKVDNYEGCE